MNAAFRRDLSAVFNTADFAVEAVSRCGTVVGIFDNGEAETETDYGREVVRGRSVFITRSDVELDEGDTLTIGQTRYRIMYPVDDGEGVVRLYLEIDG